MPAGILPDIPAEGLQVFFSEERRGKREEGRSNPPQVLDDSLIVLPGPLRTRDVIKACSLQLTENQPLRGIPPAAKPPLHQRPPVRSTHSPVGERSDDNPPPLCPIHTICRNLPIYKKRRYMNCAPHHHSSFLIPDFLKFPVDTKANSWYHHTCRREGGGPERFLPKELQKSA